MRLTRHTDVALRIMIRLAQTPGERVAIRILAADCDAPENHVMKITPTLARAGLVRSVRGRIGGLVLARAPEDIALGEIVRVTEPGFSQASDACEAQGGLADAIADAAAAYLDALNRYRLSDMLKAIPACRVGRANEDLPTLAPVT